MVQGTLEMDVEEVVAEKEDISFFTGNRMTSFKGPLTDIEWALDKAGLNWVVEKRPLFVGVDGPDGAPGADLRLMNGFRATVGIRPHGDPIHLGVVSEDYGIVDNMEAAAMMSPLLESGKFEIAKAGMTPRGRVWMMVRNRDRIDVTGKGDYIYNHMMGIWDHAAGKSLEYAFMGNRLACDNAIYRALYDLNKGSFVQDRMAFRHTSGVHHTMNTVREMFETFDRAQDVNFKLMRRLAQKNLSPAQIKSYVDSLFPYAYRDDMTDDQRRRRKESVDKKREKMLLLHENGMGLDVAPRGTAWAIYSAATEFIDHDLSRNKQDYMDYAIFGSGNDLRVTAIKHILPLVA